MIGGTAFLRGPGYILGETQTEHTAIEEFPALAARLGLALNAGLWGWGSIRTTRRELEDLAVDTGRATLAASGLEPAQIDAVVLCSNRIPGPAEGHGRFVQAVLTGIGLGDIPCYGQHRRILLITTDKVAEGADRMSQFAMFSDGAASCVVAADAGQAGTSYQLLGCATAQDTATLEWTSQISSDLARDVNRALLDPPGLKLGDIAALMHANLFKPLVVMKERQAGFSAGQLYLDNITRLGHCFAADPLINLVDRADAVGPGRYCLLASSVPGSRIGALLGKVR